jgi:hypothetical protein
MDLYHIEPSFDRTLSRASPVLDNLLDPLLGQLLRLGVGAVEGNRRGPPDVVRPSFVIFVRKDSGCPGRESGGFTASMSKLDADLLVLGVSELGDLSKPCDVVVGPETDVPRRDASLRLNACSLDNGQSGSSSEDSTDCEPKMLGSKSFD